MDRSREKEWFDKSWIVGQALNNLPVLCANGAFWVFMVLASTVLEPWFSKFNVWHRIKTGP